MDFTAEKKHTHIPVEYKVERSLEKQRIKRVSFFQHGTFSSEQRVLSLRRPSPPFSVLNLLFVSYIIQNIYGHVTVKDFAGVLTWGLQLYKSVLKKTQKNTHRPYKRRKSPSFIHSLGLSYTFATRCILPLRSFKRHLNVLKLLSTQKCFVSSGKLLVVIQAIETLRSLLLVCLRLQHGGGFFFSLMHSRSCDTAGSSFFFFTWTMNS